MDIDKEYDITLARTSKLEERRAAVTSTYLTVNTLISTVISFLVKDANINGLPAKVALGAFLTTGILTTFVWRAILNQLSRLVGYWYTRARGLESLMQGGNQLITKEYEELYIKGNGQRPLGLTQYERALTWLFTLIYAGFLGWGVSTLGH